MDLSRGASVLHESTLSQKGSRSGQNDADQGRQLVPMTPAAAGASHPQLSTINPQLSSIACAASRVS